jgi:citrate synthase
MRDYLRQYLRSISALWGPLHGGADQAVLEDARRNSQMAEIQRRIWLKAKDKDDPFRLMGFGHRVYFDPRAQIIERSEVLETLGVDDPYFGYS